MSENWMMNSRKAAVAQMMQILMEFGGLEGIMGFEVEFLKTVSYRLGCKEAKAKEYLDVIRGAVAAEARLRNRSEEPEIDDEKKHDAETKKRMGLGLENARLQKTDKKTTDQIHV